MILVKLFKPTKGRIAIFIILFAVIALLDQTFLFFPQSPLTYNVFNGGTIPFIVYLIVIPYIVSCIVPAFFIREFRHAKLHEYFEKHVPKASGDVTEVLDNYEELQDRYARSMREAFQKTEEKAEMERTKTEEHQPKPKKARKIRRKAARARTGRRR
jgi:hypothetical protein